MDVVDVAIEPRDTGLRDNRIQWIDLYSDDDDGYDPFGPQSIVGEKDSYEETQ